MIQSPITKSVWSTKDYIFLAIARYREALSINAALFGCSQESLSFAVLYLALIKQIAEPACIVNCMYEELQTPLGQSLKL